MKRDARALLWDARESADVIAGLAQRIPGISDIIGFRNVLIHGYATIDRARVWQTVQEDLPGLLATLNLLLSELK